MSKHISTPHQELTAIGAISAATLLWGLSYVITKFALWEIHPFALFFLRMTIASALLVGLLKLRGRSLRALFAHWRKALPLAVGGVLVSQFGFLLGMTFTSPSHGALIYTLLPIFTAIIARVFKNSRLHVLQVVSIIIAFIGAVVLVTEGGGISFENRFFVGDLFMFCAMLGWSYYTVFSKPVVQSIGAVNTITLTFILCLPVAVPTTLYFVVRQDWSAVSTQAWSAAAFLIVFATVITVQFFNYSLKHLPPVTVAVFIYAQPVVAAIASVIMLGEELTLRFYIAAAMILVGLILFRVQTPGSKTSPQAVSQTK